MEILKKTYNHCITALEIDFHEFARLYARLLLGYLDSRHCRRLSPFRTCV